MGILGTQTYGGIVDRELLGRCGLWRLEYVRGPESRKSGHFGGGAVRCGDPWEQIDARHEESSPKFLCNLGQVKSDSKLSDSL